MKAVINSNIAQTPGITCQSESFLMSDDFRISGFVKEEDNFSLSVFSLLFSKNNIKVSLKGNKIIIITSEMVNNENTNMYVDWQIYQQKSYIRMRSINIILPGKNFYLLRHYFIPEEFQLKIILKRKDVQ